MSSDNIRQLFATRDNSEPSQSYARGPGKTYSRGPVLEAYADTGALDVPCINCGAKAGEFCWHDPQVGGMPRRLPCPKRILCAARAQTNPQPQTSQEGIK